MSSLFIISLDFELHWGVFDKRDREARMQCYRQMEWVVPAMLKLFDRYGVKATWAVVGSLMVENEAEWQSLVPEKVPAYTNTRYSSFHYAEMNGLRGAAAAAHFAPDLVKAIIDCPGQELATHTFSHYYCLEAGQDPEAFSADLQRVQELAIRKTGRPVTSLVFPRNQYAPAYLDVCARHGITAVRTNPANWFWTSIGNEDTSIMRRIFRTGDVFIPMGAKSAYPLESMQWHQGGNLLCIPASRLLRQYDPALPWMNNIRLHRIRREMEYAARNGQCYHLWWHPENFGFHPQESLQELEGILQHFHILQQRFGMESFTMAEVANLCSIESQRDKGSAH
ncbi:MAG: polysaccharide deacetylase family protein [Chitinophagaceae bacterium]|nr:polysaccharide deacetylase family protein [Chitinophagaceae bacterium]